MCHAELLYRRVCSSSVQTWAVWVDLISAALEPFSCSHPRTSELRTSGLSRDEREGKFLGRAWKITCVSKVDQLEARRTTRAEQAGPQPWGSICRTGWVLVNICVTEACVTGLTLGWQDLA